MPRSKCEDRTGEVYKHMYIPEIRMYTDAKLGEADYMAISSRWRELRQKRLRIDDYKCVRCGSAMNLEIHHIRYPSAWGLEKIDDLLTVCSDCHKEIHNIGKED